MVNRDGQTPRVYIELRKVEGAPDGVAYPVRVSFLPEGYYPNEYQHDDGRLYRLHQDADGRPIYVATDVDASAWLPPPP